MFMFKKVLIANRGEIAVRIIRACQEMGIATVAVFSEVDREALHTQLADEAICIGPAKASESYLNIQQILSAAVVTNSEAIHPGFGFLSENNRFAAMCEEINISFIGPESTIIDVMGNKINARKLMKEAGVFVIPGSDSAITSVEEALTIAQTIGYPIMLKASAGGGGKGVRKVVNAEELPQQFQSASSEALAAFGNDNMYIEKIIYPARHIEVQILGDKFGHIIHLGERDCSLQRNNQKVLEESPSTAINTAQRKKLGETALRAAAVANYQNAGTIEFLMDEHGNFYFMEMNTRIQVEHTITEMVTGIDIVKKQIEIAAGLPLELTQKDIRFSGHAIECRINAENPENNFVSMPGQINRLHLPSGGIGMRVDSAMFSGYRIPAYYDSMIAKIIVHGENRFEALMKMQRALNELVTEGVTTNSGFQLDLLCHPQFLKGNYNTAFIQEQFLPKWLSE